MMRFIDSDDAIVGDLLANTLALVAEAGGWISPSMRFVGRDGQLSVQSSVDSTGPLLHIPQQAFVRVDEVTWSDNTERLEILGVPDHLGDIELEMLYTQVALHNQCKKLPWLVITHPWLANDLPDEVISSIRKVLPTFRETPMTASDVLWANRCFKIPVEPAGPLQRVLVPLVDLLNHHSGASKGDWTQSAFDVAAAQPFDTSECAMNYGMDRDAIEMAAVYGFPDLSSTIAHSAPLEIEVPQVGLVRVLGETRNANGENPTIEIHVEAGIMTINHLTFTTDPSKSVSEQLLAKSVLSQAQVTLVRDSIRAANIEFMDEIIRRCTRGTPEIGESAKTLATAATHNRSIFEDH